MNASPLPILRRISRSVLWSIGAFGCVLLVMLMMAHSSHTHSTSATAPVSFVQDEPAIESLGEAPTQAEVAAAIFIARPAMPTDAEFEPLGDLDDLSMKTAITFTPFGAGIESLKLPDDFVTVAAKVHVMLQARYELEGTTKFATPFAAMAIKINDSFVDLGGWEYPIWSQVSVGVFEAFVDDVDGNPVVRIERRFTLKPNEQHGVYRAETMENLTNAPIRARLISTGAIDMHKADSSYGGDRRRVRYGFLLPPEQQGTSLSVTVDDELKNRNKLLGKKQWSRPQ